MFAFIDVPGHCDGRVDFGKAAVKPVDATYDGWFAHDHGGDAVVGGRHQFGSQVASTDVFRERGRDVAGDFGIQIKREFETCWSGSHDVRRSDQRVEQ